MSQSKTTEFKLQKYLSHGDSTNKGSTLATPCLGVDDSATDYEREQR